MTLPFLCCAAITSVSALTSLGFSVSAALGSSAASRTPTLYTLARSAALAAASLAAFVVAAPAWLEAMASIMILVQIGDGLVGVRNKDPLKTFGPFITACANLAALWYLLRS